MRIGHSWRVLRRTMVIRLQAALVYRGEMALFTLMNLTLPLISLMVWRAAERSGARLPVDDTYLPTYFVLLTLVSMLTSSWLAGTVPDHIRLGELSSWLVRPASTILRYVAENIAEKVLKLAVVVPVAAVVWFAVRDSVVLPGSPLRWLLFVVSLVLATVLVFALDLMVSSLAFWLDEVAAIRRAQFSVAAVLSGQLVPLALMPEWSRGVVDAQPFRYTVSFPIEIVTTGLSSRGLAVGLCLQIGYAGLACAGAVALWRRGLRSYTAVGA